MICFSLLERRRMIDTSLNTPWQDIIEHVHNEAIVKAFLKANSIINNYRRPYCSISGGKDSDIMLDIIYRVDRDKKVRYVWFDTGIEYQATKDHLEYLESKYNIVIERIKAIKPIPLSCKEYGQPFLSKRVSDMISRLQKHNFKWEDKPFDELYKEYPKCKAALRWWCSNWGGQNSSQFDITQNKYLKEFMIANPPTFLISNKCCDYAKKNVGKRYVKDNNNDLCINGVRKAEGGARATAYKNCFDNNKSLGTLSYYRPLFYFSNNDIKEYSEIFNVRHSDCYEVYGLKRTGCVGCPYGRNLLDELEVIKDYEPNLAVAVHNIFSDSYKYTMMYKDFVREQKKSDKINQ